MGPIEAWGLGQPPCLLCPISTAGFTSAPLLGCWTLPLDCSQWAPSCMHQICQWHYQAPPHDISSLCHSLEDIGALLIHEVPQSKPDH